jgi:hypothetical protein
MADLLANNLLRLQRVRAWREQALLAAANSSGGGGGGGGSGASSNSNSSSSNFTNGSGGSNSSNSSRPSEAQITVLGAAIFAGVLRQLAAGPALPSRLDLCCAEGLASLCCAAAPNARLLTSSQLLTSFAACSSLLGTPPAPSLPLCTPLWVRPMHRPSFPRPRA